MPAKSRETPVPAGKRHPAAAIDFNASIAMAGHYLAVVEAYRRVQVALEHGPAALTSDVEDDPNVYTDYDPLLWEWAGGSVVLLPAAVLAAEYTTEQLREMAANLEACIARHHKQMVRGYRGALQAEQQTRLVRATRALWGEAWKQSERALNRFVAMGAGMYIAVPPSGSKKRRKIGDESFTRRQTAKRSPWTVLDVEPRCYRRPKVR
jgi:hypothetical protein